MAHVIDAEADAVKASPIIPWPGGKRKLAKQIIEHLPPHRCYVEPFCGGAGVFFCKKQSDVEVLNDINGDLINLYRVVKAHPEEFIKQFDFGLGSRELFNDWKSASTCGMTDIQRAARFYYLQRCAFGAKVTGQNFGYSALDRSRLNLSKYESEIAAAHKRLLRVTIENLPFDDCIKRYDRSTTLFYADPPYYGLIGYGVSFGESEYEKLATMARSISGQIFISLNDCEFVRDLFAGLKIIELETKYSIKNNRGSTQKIAKELLISNF